jgi:hypothetical protein
MNDEAPNVSWRQLRDFADVDLGRSFVLSWQAQGDLLTIDIDLYLEPGHPFYERPRPAEKVCIRPACIEFSCCDELRLAGSESGKPADIVEKVGIGAIADLRVVADGRYEFSGDFGTVLITAERPILRLQGP